METLVFTARGYRNLLSHIGASNERFPAWVTTSYAEETEETKDYWQVTMRHRLQHGPTDLPIPRFTAKKYHRYAASDIVEVLETERTLHHTRKFQCSFRGQRIEDVCFLA